MTQVQPSTRLSIAGDGAQKTALVQLIHQLELQDRVTIMGLQTHIKMPAVYQSAVLHILPSRHEGLGMVTLEAAACGVMTLSTPVGIVPDFPELGECVESGNPQQMAQAINRLLSNSDDLIERGRAAQSLTRERLTIQHTAAAFLALYQTLQ
jgi:glycosyltransferase involved in cell wall biosynthesis